MCLFTQTQFQLGSYIHACTNETHSLTNYYYQILAVRHWKAYTKGPSLYEVLLQDLNNTLASLCCL